jgi:hypothetical protein
MKSKQLIKITARKFKAAIKRDPAWALTLTEPVEITGYCNMRGSAISHLSPLLHFAGTNAKGEAASFASCHHLKVAEGTFNGFVNFSDSGITRIGELNIVAPSECGFAADFFRCKALEKAEGTFPGCVDFALSGIKKIGDLTITHPHKNGIKAIFFGCDIRLPAEFLGPEYKMNDSTRQKNLKRIAAGIAL